MQEIDTFGSDTQTGKQASKEVGSFDKNLMGDIQNYAAIKAKVAKGREKLNAELAAAQTGLVDKGFNKDALKAANKYADTPEEKRQNFDLTYSFAREALGCPIQGDMLLEASIERKTEAHSETSKTH